MSQPRQKEKAYDFAQDLVKQIITLSTGIIALTITFAKDFVGAAPDGAKVVMDLSYVFYLLAVAFGIATMMALAGSLNVGHVDISGDNMKRPAALQIICFMFGLILTVAAGIWAL